MQRARDVKSLSMVVKTLVHAVKDFVSMVVKTLVHAVKDFVEDLKSKPDDTDARTTLMLRGDNSYGSAFCTGL